MRILLAGGGSGGPVSPVLAVAEEIKKLRPKAEFLFVGTRKGPEKAMVEAAGLRFMIVPAARWRRFISLKNIFAPFIFVCGFLASLRIVGKFRPHVMFAAGAFVAVPVAWAAKIYGCKIVIHQQDARIGLANRLISVVASEITTVFESTSQQFYSGSGLIGKLKPAIWVGNPVRPDLTLKKEVKLPFALHDNLPILLVLGGATGAMQINFMIEQSLPQLTKSFQVVHQTGKGKGVKFSGENYHQAEIFGFDQYAHLLQNAHMVVCRAGLSTIAELSALAKPAIVIPMPFTHQEDNAVILELTRSAVVLGHNQAHAPILLKVITALNFDPSAMKEISTNIGKLMPKDAALKLAEIIIKQ